MSLSSTTLLVLQKVGSAAFAADAKLKAEVKEYSQRVHDAMVANPDGQKNDALFANWKIVTRLSQAISSIEGELKKLFETAAALGAEAPASAPLAKLAKAAKPAAATKRAVKKSAKASAKVEPVAAVEVVSAKTKPAGTVKAKATPKVAPKAAAKAAAKAAPKAAAKPVAAAKVKAAAKPKAKTATKKGSAKTAGPVTLGANPTKVLRHLETLLNANDFSVISQTAVSKETGIPLGSMTAATKKLMETGHLLAGPSGSFKLANAPVAAL